MAKNALKKDNSNLATTEFKPLSTKRNDIIFVTDIPMSTYFTFAGNEKCIIAKDDKGLYITTTNYVGTNLLDPFKMKHRNNFVINKNEDETYSISMTSY